LHIIDNTWISLIILMKKAHGTNRMVEEQKHWRILYENDTKRRIQQGLCKNLKKNVILHFSTRKHNLVSFFGRIVSGRMNIARVNIGFFTGFKKIKQQRISFVLGYLPMILWKNSTAISIKHRILATFNYRQCHQIQFWERII
jgi:hypothetical protein